MEIVWIVLVSLICILLLLWIQSRIVEKRRIRKEREEQLAREREQTRQQLFGFYKEKIQQIFSACTAFEKHMLYKNGYFSNHTLYLWVNQYQSLFNEISDKPYKDIHLSTAEVEGVDKFLNYFNNDRSIRTSYNQRFLENELEEYNSFFNNVEGRILDIQQRTAIINDEDNNLVIAGAGSGKTTTMIGKVSYIINRYKIKPEEILLISFTNKSAMTLRDRIAIEGVEAKTFHKFGKDVIVESEKKQPSIFDEDQFGPLVRRFFNELIQDETYLTKVTEFFQDYLKAPKSQFEFKDQGDYIQYIKDQNFRTYKSIPVKGRNGLVTYKMEVVKSIEECRIANFLLFNGLNYEYEFPYEHETANENYRQYKPDFTVIQDGRKVYIEHFALSKNGDVPSWFVGDGIRDGREKYHDDIAWKRLKHQEYNTVLIETYSYEMHEGNLFINLSEKLAQHGLTLQLKSPGEIWGIITEVAKEEVNSIINLFQTFINLLGSNNYTIEDAINRNNQVQSDFFKKRNELFIKIIKPIFEKYQNHLKRRGEIDFNDMINKASTHIQTGSYHRNIKYILIDEFQDISIGRYKLIKALKDKNPACKMFCVGDDWQSIYRFTGSDIALFKDFEKYFGYTIRSKIETTYRFHEPLISISSSFILKNPNQSKKELRGLSSGSTTFKIQYSISENQDDTDILKSIIGELVRSVENIQEKKILILGRYSFDIDRIKNETGLFSINKQEGNVAFRYVNNDDESFKIDMQFLTVHKSKGLEADIVIVLNCNSGKFGFPAELSDDEVLNLLLSEADQFENGEERRLFYVAMSRARESVFFIADSSYKSKFIAELEVDCGDTNQRKCPYCKTSDVILRKSGTTKNGDNYQFFGCSNYLYGCDYHITEFGN